MEKFPASITCPKCGSAQLFAGKKGFSGKKAVAGAIVTGGIGVLAGTIGSNQVLLTCLACGHKFKAGEGNISHDVPISSSDPNELESFIIKKIQSDGLLKAIQAYKEFKGVGLEESKKMVDEIAERFNVKPAVKTNSGCAGIVLVVILGIVILWIV